MSVFQKTLKSRLTVTIDRFYEEWLYQMAETRGHRKLSTELNIQLKNAWRLHEKAQMVKCLNCGATFSTALVFCPQCKGIEKETKKEEPLPIPKVEAKNSTKKNKGKKP